MTSRFVPEHMLADGTRGGVEMQNQQIWHTSKTAKKSNKIRPACPSETSTIDGSCTLNKLHTPGSKQVSRLAYSWARATQHCLKRFSEYEICWRLWRIRMIFHTSNFAIAEYISCKTAYLLFLAVAHWLYSAKGRTKIKSSRKPEKFFNWKFCCLPHSTTIWCYRHCFKPLGFFVINICSC